MSPADTACHAPANAASSQRSPLEQIAVNQQTDQRLDALATGVGELHGGVGTRVRAIKAIAESSKVTATILHRQAARNT